MTKPAARTPNGWASPPSTFAPRASAANEPPSPAPQANSVPRIRPRLTTTVEVAVTPLRVATRRVGGEGGPPPHSPRDDGRTRRAAAAGRPALRSRRYPRRYCRAARRGLAGGLRGDRHRRGPRPDRGSHRVRRQAPRPRGEPGRWAPAGGGRGRPRRAGGGRAL